MRTSPVFGRILPHLHKPLLSHPPIQNRKDAQGCCFEEVSWPEFRSGSGGRLARIIKRPAAAELIDAGIHDSCGADEYFPLAKLRGNARLWGPSQVLTLAAK